MKYPFKELPGRLADYLRPVVPVEVEGLPRAPQLCLLDTGALHSRFGAWVAEAAGIDLGDGQPERIALGGFATVARSATVRLTLGETSWDATVWFCDPWPLSFHLLGQEGFFRWFDVRVRAAGRSPGPNRPGPNFWREIADLLAEILQSPAKSSVRTGGMIRSSRAHTTSAGPSYSDSRSAVAANSAASTERTKRRERRGRARPQPGQEGQLPGVVCRAERVRLGRQPPLQTDEADQDGAEDRPALRCRRHARQAGRVRAASRPAGE